MYRSKIITLSLIALAALAIATPSTRANSNKPGRGGGLFANGGICTVAASNGTSSTTFNNLNGRLVATLQSTNYNNVAGVVIAFAEPGGGGITLAPIPQGTLSFTFRNNTNRPMPQQLVAFAHYTNQVGFPTPTILADVNNGQANGINVNTVIPSQTVSVSTVNAGAGTMFHITIYYGAGNPPTTSLGGSVIITDIKVNGVEVPIDTTNPQGCQTIVI